MMKSQHINSPFARALRAASAKSDRNDANEMRSLTVAMVARKKLRQRLARPQAHELAQ